MSPNSITHEATMKQGPLTLAGSTYELISQS